MSNDWQDGTHLALDELDLDEGRVGASLAGDAKQAATVSFTGTPKIVPDSRFGSCLFLDGKSDILTSITDLSGDALTVAYWFRGTSMQSAVRQQKHGEDPSIICEHVGQGHLLSFDGSIHGRLPVGPTWNDGSWHHFAITWQRNTDPGFISYFDGKVVAQRKSSDNPIPKIGEAVRLGSYGGKDEFTVGCLANVRIFRRALAVDDIHALMHADQTASSIFQDINPLDFRLLDDEGQSVLYIVHDDAGCSLRLQVRNTATHPIVIEDLGVQEPSAETHHLSVSFRPGTLVEGSWAHIGVGDEGWKIAARCDPGPVEIVTLYLLAPPSMIAPGAAIEVALDGLRADGHGGSRGSRIELAYRNVSFEGQPVPLVGHRLQHVEIINRRGKETLPLQVGVVGSAWLLNDGKTPNTIELQLRNPGRDAIELSPADATAPTRWIVSAESGQSPAALATAEQLGAITIKVPDGWSVRLDDQGIGPSWVITSPLTRFAGGASFILRLTNIITSNQPGQASLHIRHENVPGYWDGQTTCTVERSPICLQQDRVGIGTTTPRSALEVTGDVVGHNLSVAPSNEARGVVFLGPVDRTNLNHAIYNNWQNLDGQGSFDGAKWNVYAGLDIRVGQAKTSALHIDGTGNIDVVGGRLRLEAFDSGAQKAGRSQGVRIHIPATAIGESAQQLEIQTPRGREDNKVRIGRFNTESPYGRNVTLEVSESYGTNTVIEIDTGNTGKGYLWGSTAQEGDWDGLNLSFNYYWLEQNVPREHRITNRGYATSQLHLNRDGSISLRNNGAAAAPVERMVIDPAGAVRVRSMLYAEGGFEQRQVSDVALKADIHPLVAPLERIRALRGVSFRWNEAGRAVMRRLGDPRFTHDDGESGPRIHGFIAQEVAQVFPQWVARNADDLATLDTSELLPYLVEAIKEQQRELEALRAELRRLGAGPRQ